MISHFKDLLAQVIPKLIDHDILNEWLNALDQSLFKFLFSVLIKLFLQHSASLLVIAIKLYLFENVLIFFRESLEIFELLRVFEARWLGLLILHYRKFFQNGRLTI